MLRLRGVTESATRRERRRQTVQSVTGIAFANELEEANDPVAADDLIEEGVEKLRELTRGDNFKLVLIENGWYGFHRNLYGLRWIGRCIALVCFVGLALIAAWAQHHNRTSVDVNSLEVGAVLSGLWFLIWLFGPSAGRTKQSAEKYARQLLQAASTITPPTTS